MGEGGRDADGGRERVNGRGYWVRERVSGGEGGNGRGYCTG